ncbi:MAG: hypothetical protein ABI601_00950 [bacterium]
MASRVAELAATVAQVAAAVTGQQACWPTHGSMKAEFAAAGIDRDVRRR